MPLPTRRGTALALLRNAAAGLLLAAGPAGAQARALITPTVGIPATAPAPPRPLTREDLEAGTLRVGRVRFDRVLHAELRRAFAGGQYAPPRTVTVSPFPDATFTLVLRQSAFATAASDEFTVLSGEVQQVGDAATAQPRPPGAQGSYTMVLYGSELTLSIFSPAGNYHIHAGQDGRLEAFQENPAAPVNCGNHLLRDAAGPPPSLTPVPSAAPTSAAPVTPDAPSEIVVLVLYTDEAVSAVGGDEAGFQAEVTKGLALANTAFQNSGIKVTARLATGRAVRAPDSFKPSAGFGSDLKHLQASDQIAELRARHKADVVTLARGRGDAWGIAGGLADFGKPSAAQAFGVVYARKFVDGLVFAHALGHTLGAAHNPEHIDATGVFPYARGWHGGVGEDARTAIHVGTIMSDVGQRIPFFSTPRVRYQGVAIGSERQDNARAINESRTMVGAYQE